MIRQMISVLRQHDLLLETKNLDSLPASITGIQTDHRLLKAGEIFVCIKGESFDGHSVIAAALQKGAALIVCQQKPEADYPALWVGDTRKAAALLARI
ncbi:MAG TPA: Mur ligase domain-containing protein, partial [Candidatus Cloacimonas sp.]|nr:Mur ligase domain-containing protein [Candidatus Cloacimonas sp.]